MAGPWAATLPPRGFAAIRAAGFDPVGRVRGTGSYHVELSGETWNWHAYDCRLSVTAPRNPKDPAPIRLSGAGATSEVLVQVLEGSRRRALERLRAACSALGGHGVVGVQVNIAPSEVASLGMDFQASGTAVRARGVSGPVARPFVSHLPGEDLTKLVLAGWVPVDLLVGRSIGVRHEDASIHDQLRAATNQELDGWTALLTGIRADARTRLLRQAREHGGDGILLDAGEITVHEHPCAAKLLSPGHQEPTDRVAQCLLIGTTLTPFTPTPPGPSPSPSSPCATAGPG
ncbi:heavy metal-binding domain-containing protein [Streptacidiphilus rugosus]|uniref:heavy metal-binding domain-containing protein n=1 Tax=Streptacidiphilus rugosus TaxID=405783 RepID=UPI00068C600D|nr:heavy metal-binding domain-containing protein [Streptacidiphilus rugosus]